MDHNKKVIHMFTNKNMTGNNNTVMCMHVYVYLRGQMGFFM